MQQQLQDVAQGRWIELWHPCYASIPAFLLVYEDPMWAVPQSCMVAKAGHVTWCNSTSSKVVRAAQHEYLWQPGVGLVLHTAFWYDAQQRHCVSQPTTTVVKYLLQMVWRHTVRVVCRFIELAASQLFDRD